MCLTTLSERQPVKVDTTGKLWPAVILGSDTVDIFSKSHCLSVTIWLSNDMSQDRVIT